MKENYLTVWRAFNKFLVRLDRQTYRHSWEERTSLFATYLINQGTQSSTLKSYFSAIKFMVKLVGYEWDDNKVILTLLTKSCRLRNDSVMTRLPIQHNLLEMLLFEIEHIYHNQINLQIMYKALFMMSYYGLMRVGELTETTQFSNHAVKACDIHIGRNKRKLLIMLYSSKTHGKESKPQRIKISATPTYCVRTRFFCPFRTIRTFINLRGGYYDRSDHLFIFKDGSNVKGSHFRTLLKLTLKRLNINHELFNTHSFRIGKTTDLFKAGYSVEAIKQIGRWTSNAVYRYIKF